jgi:hypothetical protein
VQTEPVQVARRSYRKTYLFVGCAAVAMSVCVYGFLPAKAPYAQVEALVVAAAEPVATPAVEVDEVEEDPYKEREMVAASWARHIVEIDPQVARSVQQLWEMLTRRKSDLEDIAQELTSLLNDNAYFREDFVNQNATVLLARYQAMDARHSMSIANKINAISCFVHDRNNPDLSLAYSEMLAELGCESFTTHQVQIAKELVRQDDAFDQALQKVNESIDLLALAQSVNSIARMMQGLEDNGLFQTFSRIEEYQERLRSAARESLDRLLSTNLAPNVCSPEGRSLLESILLNSDIRDADCQKYIEKFESKALESKPVQPQPTSQFVML